MVERMISVRFIHDFAPYSIKAGQERMVSVGVADKLLNEYGVIEPYEQTKNRMVVIRVRKNLSKVFPGWWPGSEHLADTGIVQQYLDDHSLEIVDSKTPVNDKPAEPAGEPVPVPLQSPVNYENERKVWTFRQDYGEYRKGQTIRATTLEMQMGNKILYAVNWDGLE